MKIARPESFLRAPDFGLLAVLVYGPDSGLVRERALDLAKGVVPDLTDPFRAVEITADALTGDSARLADEVAAIAMTGGRRVVIVREAGDRIGPARKRKLFLMASIFGNLAIRGSRWRWPSPKFQPSTMPATISPSTYS